MALSIGIVGLPNVGKSTLFKAITKKQVDCENYPFCTIEPNVGMVAVPDERVDRLSDLTKSAKKLYATIEFLDIAGLVEGAHKGEGLGNQFLSHIREVDAIVYVLHVFENKNIVKTSELDPARDKEILDTELVLKDLETVDKRVAKLEKESKSGASQESAKELNIFGRVKKYLEDGEILSEKEWADDELEILKSSQFLTMKPRIYLLNGSKEEADKYLDKFGDSALFFDVVAEAEGAGLSREERKELEMPEDSQLDKLIQKSYELLDLISFLTTGPDETRAWQIKRGSKAPQAAGVIHTDFEKRFIRAEAINWKDLLDAGGYPQAREKGLLRVEGKDYTVQDGDVLDIRHDA
ncbi:MAG: redox-regulated ATPase YchF [Patescibacteria group bacterium]|nr:redox-regulated ATPase YchF [Patescibacteria group bacterium]